MRTLAMLRHVAITILLTVPLLPAAFAHEGEDHGPPPQAASADAAPRAESTTSSYELVAVARNGELTIYLDRFRSNEPVTGAIINVEMPAGDVAASVTSEGTYRVVAPWSAKPGRYDLIFTVVENGTADVLAATLAVLAEPNADAGAPSSLTSTGLGRTLKARIIGSDHLLISAAGGGFGLGVLVTVLIARRRVVPALALVAGMAVLVGSAAFAHEGEDHGEATPAVTAIGDRELAKRLPDGSLAVPKSTQRILAVRTDIIAGAAYRRTIELPGRIIPDPNASGYVQASAGGRLSAPEGGFPRLGTRVKEGDVLAYVTAPLQAIDVSDMRQRQGELDQQISIVERRIARYEPLAQKGVMTQVQLDEAKLELQGLKDRRGALDRVRLDPEALVAPVSGVVAEVNAIAGQMAQPSAILFQIVEPDRLWVEALSFDALTGGHTGTARTGSGRALTLTYQGAGFADRNQAIPVHFKIDGDTGGLRVGQLVTVLAATEDEKQGLAVPRASVVRSQAGQDIVFEHTSAERFQPRSVRVEPFDGERVLVVSGLASGARVVTQGAELLDQIR